MVRNVLFLCVVLVGFRFGSATLLALPEQCEEICNWSSNGEDECGVGYTMTTCLTYGFCDPATVCGNGTCDGTVGESACSCEEDCGTCLEEEEICGDYACTEHESYRTCPTDCSAPTQSCGDHVCSGSEDPSNCEVDCLVTREYCGGSGPSCPSSYSCMSGRCVYNDGVFLAVQCSSNNQCNWNQYCALTGYVDYLNGMMIPYGICVPR